MLIVLSAHGLARATLVAGAVSELLRSLHLGLVPTFGVPSRDMLLRFIPRLAAEVTW